MFIFTRRIILTYEYYEYYNKLYHTIINWIMQHHNINITIVSYIYQSYVLW